MLTPAYANRQSWFYAVGNTPAINLARSVPHGENAAVLSLGCGDVRNVLYTAYVQRDLPARKFDITCCDYDEKTIGRNIILFTLIIDGSDAVSDEELWNIYYHLYLESTTNETILKHTKALSKHLVSLDAWKSSPYGQYIKFCDRDTLNDVQNVCQKIINAAEAAETEALRSELAENMKISRDILGNNIVNTNLRSIAPVLFPSNGFNSKGGATFWTEGTVIAEKMLKSVPNPMFAGLMSRNEVLHYGTDPLLGFHLAVAHAPLSEHSPLRSEAEKEDEAEVVAARLQFYEWTTAFRKLYKKCIILRFIVAEVFTFCHTVQYASTSKKTTANLYRRQFDLKTLSLDGSEYGSKGSAPVEFDVIDTSNLSDHIGALNILVSTADLLRAKPWATLYTEKLLKRNSSQKDAFADLLCGPTSTVSLLLGITSLQYWTNAKPESHVHEIFMGMFQESFRKQHGETQYHDRLAWKRDDSFTPDQKGRPKLHVEAGALAEMIFKLYLNMFKAEKLPNTPTANDFLQHLSAGQYGHFHRLSLVALLKLVMTRIKTDWPTVFEKFFHLISRDRTLILGSNYVQDLATQLFLADVHTEPWIIDSSLPPTQTKLFKDWDGIPPVICVTVVVPKSAVDALFPVSYNQKTPSPAFVGSLRSAEWHNCFGDVHLVFGKVFASDGDCGLKIEQDPLGWGGNSPLIASFMTPSPLLQMEPEKIKVGINIPPTGQNSVLYLNTLGPSLSVFETKATNGSEFFVSKLLPGKNANGIIGQGGNSFVDELSKVGGEGPMKFTANISEGGNITMLTGHIDISSSKGKKLLADKVPIELIQVNPFVIEVVIGHKKLICPLRFPAPVRKDGSKTRIARKSGYIEVIAPIATPTVDTELSDFISPTVLTLTGLPVALNTSHLNLDNLPILDVSRKEKLSWLNTLTSLQFSAREKRLRSVAVNDTGISMDVRVNMKESLFTMFMLSSGLQGGQTGLFAITHPEKGGIHMLLFVTALRLDGDSLSVVLDAAVIPLTTRLIESGKMESFLILIRGLECCTIKVNDAELLLWKKILPSLAERCRTWNHRSTCEYKGKNTTTPISLEFGEPVLCTCGNGKLPKNFMPLPEWETASRNAVRIAINPLYAVPFVEDVVEETETSAFTADIADLVRCRKCKKPGGEGGAKLKKCMRCQRVKYCSVECQKADWKIHRGECEPSK